MKLYQEIRMSAGVAVLATLLTGVALSAHSVTYQGTVLGVEAARVQVKTVDAATKNEDTVWFAVNKDTKVKRGDTVMAYAEAKIAKGERIVVTIDHDAAIKMLAIEIRLAASASAAAEETWTGKLSESMCKADHGSKGGTMEKDRACTLDCVKNMGSQYVLVVDSKIFKIGNQKFADLAAHAGHTVQLTGELKGDTITVSKIVMSKEER